MHISDYIANDYYTHKDPLGTVRRSPEGIVVARRWRKLAARFGRAGEYLQDWVTLCGSVEQSFPSWYVADWPIIGAVPGTPAAEAQQKAGS